LGIFDRKKEGPEYQLQDIPIVFHLLKNFNNGAEGNPSMTVKQRDFLVAQTNRMYNIYDKLTKTEVQFATFVHNNTIVHEDQLDFDCVTLYFRRNTVGLLIQKDPEWMYKMHAVYVTMTEKMCFN
jgi:hypothetical protein